MIAARLKKRFPARPDSGAFTLEVDFEGTSGVTVLFGPSGSGKTLTLESIAGFTRPDEGRILLGGRVLFDSEANVHLPPRDRHCGYVFQNYALFPHMTIRRNLEFSLNRIPAADRQRRVDEMLRRFRLSEIAGRRPHEVSGGQQQRCSIARTLLAEPEILLLDEPARGLDAALRNELYAVLSQVRREFSIPVLLVTHDLEECFELGDEMIVMHEGRIIQKGKPKEVLARPGTLEVVKLLGRFNVLSATIMATDPGRGLTRLRVDGFEIEAPYFPRHTAGDRVSVYIRADVLRAGSVVDPSKPNQVRLRLAAAVELPSAVRLQFEGGIRAEVSHVEYDRNRNNMEWLVEFPSEHLGTVGDREAQ